MQGQADTYSKTKIFTYPNMTVRVQIPDLTEEERNRRMKAVYNAAAELLKSKELQK